jgi:aldose 1-epimerase
MAATRKLDFTTPEGEPIELYTLSSKEGLEVDIISFGATITSLRLPKKSGEGKLNAVLTHDKLEDYLENIPYLGCSVGRVAGRIANGKFTLNGKEYNLECNNGPNHLHGGLKGFSKMNWTCSENTSSSITLKLTSPHGDQGYPGEVQASVTYEVSEMCVNITYRGTCDMDTPLNLTNHAYFNLHGNSDSDILDHVLTMKADRKLELDDHSTITGEIVPVADTVYDFLTPHEIGARIGSLVQMPKKGYDDIFCISRPEDKEPEMIEMAKLTNPKNGLSLSVSTDQLVVVMYTGNYLDKIRTGVCLETQNYPDSVNQPTFPSCVLKPDEEYCSKTKWSFSWDK